MILKMVTGEFEPHDISEAIKMLEITLALKSEENESISFYILMVFCCLRVSAQESTVYSEI